MKTWLAGCLILLFSITAFGDIDPKAVVEPLQIARETFYDDVSKFQAGQLTEDELVTRISEQFAPLINDRTVALRVMGRFARQATEEERDRFADRLEKALSMPMRGGLRHMVARNLRFPTKA